MEKQEKSIRTDEESGDGAVSIYIDAEAEKACVRKLDLVLLPFLILIYFFNSVFRVSLTPSPTNLLFSLVASLKYPVQPGQRQNRRPRHRSPFLRQRLLPPHPPLLATSQSALSISPLNLLTKKFCGRLILPILTVSWGSLALIQCAAKTFAGLLVIRLLLGCCEAGFLAGVVFYLTLFYKRNALGFRIAIFFGSALLAAAFSGLISFGVFQIKSKIKGWMFLLLIEGGWTVIVGVAAFFWLPKSAETAWFFTENERAAAKARSLRDASKGVDVYFDLKAAFQTWKDWKFPIWMMICFTYPVAFSTTSNFLPQIVQRLGFDTVKTNLWTVAPNSVGFIVLLCIAKSSDHFRERTYHIYVIDVLENKGVAYFACFLMAAGAYVPSCLVHSWHNNNNMDENSRAANTGFLVGLGNLAGVISAAKPRTQYAPKHIPTLITTACCNGVSICCVLYLGIWMKRDNARKNREQGVKLRAEDVDTNLLREGEKSPEWRWST